MKRPDAALDELAALLRKRPHTAKEISAALRCCRPTAYKRIRALIDRGDPITEVIMRSKSNTTGPRATLYALKD